MTYNECIAQVDAVKPNAFSAEQKIRWLFTCEGTLLAEVFLWAQEEIDRCGEPTGATECLVRFPYDKLYPAYLSAMIDLANDEISRYQNSMQIFNAYLADFTRWYAKNYHPANRPPTPPAAHLPERT